MADFGFLKSIPGRIGNFLSGAMGDVGEFPEIIRESLRSKMGERRYVSEKGQGLREVKREGDGLISPLADSLGKELTSGMGGEKKKEEKPNMSQMTITKPTPEGGKVTIKVDVPEQQQGATPTPAQFNPEQVQQQMQSGLTQYGGENLPLLQLLSQMVGAGQRYPIFEQNPFLLPQMGILESSGGRNVGKRPSNWFNWGINIPGNDEIFAQMSPEEILELLITGIGERMPAYEPFRQNRPLTQDEIEQFAQTYEPANPDYGRSLWEGMQSFAGR